MSRAVKLQGVNCGQLGRQQKKHMVTMPEYFIAKGLFPMHPKWVPACVGGERALPLIDQKCTPVSEKQRTFTPEEVTMIRQEIQKLTDRGIIRPSNSRWAAQVICVMNSDGTLRVCVGWRKLNALLKSDSGGLSEMQCISTI